MLNIVLIVLALLKICSVFSQKVSRFDHGVMYYVFQKFQELCISEIAILSNFT